MARPHVVTHALLSADGRLEGFSPALDLYYGLAGRLRPDAILAGSGTILAAADAAGVDLSAEEASEAAAESPPADSSLPLLVIVDSRGRVPRFEWLRSAGYWRDVLVLGSERTPSEHRQRLRAVGVGLRIFGGDRVDLAAALRDLRENQGIRAARVDAGPGLNTALVTAGLVDEVSVLVAPHLVGHGRTLLDGSARSARDLRLISAEQQAKGHVWLRYAVINP
jgi:2,5-diamino-6-(ribosylamino)-4(3H)-pyrimidinone 5'-phosphate reductase